MLLKGRLGYPMDEYINRQLPQFIFRLEGYRAAMKRAGLNIPDGYEVTGDFEFNCGFDAMRQLLSHPLRPQAVFTGNDAMAVGVYQALYQAELQVPQDIAVIGYDDIELASFMTPPLTTIHQPKDELGELAIDVLIHRITQPTLQQQRLQLTPILMEGTTTVEQFHYTFITMGIITVASAAMFMLLKTTDGNNLIKRQRKSKPNRVPSESE